MTLKDISNLRDGTRVILTQTGSEWGEDCGSSGVCVKIGNRLVEADKFRPNDDNVWYPYYTIDELEDCGWECSVKLEDTTDNLANHAYHRGRIDAVDDFMQSLIDGYGVVSWMGKNYDISVRSL